MKKHVLLLILLLLHLFFPVCLGIAGILGWEFILFSELGYLLLLTALNIGMTVVLSRIDKPRPGGIALWLFPAAIIDGLCAVWFTHSLMAVPCAICWCICAGILFKIFAPKGIGKILIQILSVLLIIVLALSCPIDLFAEGMAETTVVQELDSPDGVYTAQVIDADYGATGGDTLVKVCDNARTVNLLLCRFTPEPKLVYRGEWGEFYDLDLSWEGDHTLIIGGRTYIICSGSGVVDAIFLPKMNAVTVNGTTITDPEWIADFIAALGRSRATRKWSIQDIPYQAILWRIDIPTGDLFLYEENGAYYIEQPYQGIWEADETLLELLA